MIENIRYLSVAIDAPASLTAQCLDLRRRQLDRRRHRFGPQRTGARRCRRRRRGRGKLGELLLLRLNLLRGEVGALTHVRVGERFELRGGIGVVAVGA